MTSHASPAFLWITCQVGAEPALKQELKRKFPAFHFAYSRPGFLTYKLPPQFRATPEFDLGSIFARAWGYSLGKIEGATVAERAQAAWKLAAGQHYELLHVWRRDRSAAAALPEAERRHDLAVIEQALRAAAPPGQLIVAAPLPPALPFELPPIPKGALVLDCLLVEDEDWWLGYHVVQSRVSSWPGGILATELPPGAVSRGYLKMQEALSWAEWPVLPGQRCIEVGSAPGGSSQALLQRGLQVTGIDPAEMDPILRADPQFTHLRKRCRDVKHQVFSAAQWLTVDINLPPNYTLDTVEAILAHPGVQLQGILLTLKLGDWELVPEIPKYLSRIRHWGFTSVRARQLYHNRREICVAVSQPTPRSPQPATARTASTAEATATAESPETPAARKRPATRRRPQKRPARRSTSSSKKPLKRGPPATESID